jgi:hypothetical protein
MSDSESDCEIRKILRNKITRERIDDVFTIMELIPTNINKIPDNSRGIKQIKQVFGGKVHNLTIAYLSRLVRGGIKL